MAEIKVDLSRLTVEELNEIKSAVMKRLTERAAGPVGSDMLYDRHGSGHSRSTPPSMEMDQAIKRIEALKR